MLSHTQCNRSPAWSEQWPGTASEVCLCLLPTSNEQPLQWGWEPPCTLSLAHWCASWMRGASPTTAQGTLLTPPLAEVHFQSSQWEASEPGIVVQWNACLYTCGLQTWNHSLSPIPVWHLLPAVNVSLWCPGSAHKNRLPGHQQGVLWRCPWQYKRAAH